MYRACVSGLVGVTVTVPNVVNMVNMVNMFDRACLALRRQIPSRRASPRYHRHEAPPAAASALSTPLSTLGDRFLELCTVKATLAEGGAENSDPALLEECITKRSGTKSVSRSEVV